MGKITRAKRRSKLLGILGQVDEANKQAHKFMAAKGTPVQCRKGCSACCRQWVAVFPLETDEMIHAAAAGHVGIDARELREQAAIAAELGQRAEAHNEDARTAWAKLNRPCIFLGGQGECRIYESRPLGCRSVLVLSDPKECGNFEGGVVTRIDTRKPVMKAASVINKEHELAARVPIALPIPLAVQLALEGKSPLEVTRRAGTFGVPKKATKQLRWDGQAARAMVSEQE